jgi:CO/xanthine dehydrogenase FAD-binding subunit
MKAQKGASVLAGGTLLLNALKKAARAPKVVISLRKVAGLSGIKEEKACVKIGAMVTISEVCESVVIRRNFPSLDEACCQLGTTPIRHMATIGGNVASRYFWVDLPTVLVSLDARLILETARGKKTVSLDGFLAKKEAGPFLLALIEIPKKRPVSFYCRHTKTMSVDVPTLALAFAAGLRDRALQDVSLAINTTLGFPLFLKKTAAVFEGCDTEKIPCDEVQRALEQDVAGFGLDDFKRHALAVDLEGICGRLKSGERS